MLASLSTREALARASAFGIEIRLKDEELHVRAAGHVPSILAEYIRRHRAEIIAELTPIPGEVKI
jgi:hypothetical protein